MNILNKAIKVTRSCNTLEQLAVAENFNVLVVKAITRDFADRLKMNLEFRMLEFEQRRKIYNQEK